MVWRLSATNLGPLYTLLGSLILSNDFWNRVIKVMQAISLRDWIIIALGVVAMYTPWLQLARSKKLTGKELSKTYPKLQWVRWGFIILYLSWIALVSIIFFTLLTKSEVSSPCVFGGWFASIGLFIGSFAMLTRVCIFPTPSLWLLFVVGDEAYRAGRFQVIWSLITIFISGVSAFLSG